MYIFITDICTHSTHSVKSKQ